MKARVLRDGGTWRLELSGNLKLINANQKLHWGTRKNRVAAIREAACQLAQDARLAPQPPAVVAGIYRPPRRGRRDPANWHPSLKAAIDGLVDAHVWPDDSSEWVTDGGMSLGDITPGGQLVIVITPRKDHE